MCSVLARRLVIGEDGMRYVCHFFCCVYGFFWVFVWYLFEVSHLTCVCFGGKASVRREKMIIANVVYGICVVFVWYFFGICVVFDFL